MERLQISYCRNGLNVLRLGNELVKLQCQFAAAGINALPYKGPAMAQQIYGELGVRMAGDLDIVVRDRDVMGAVDVLKSVGYKPKNGTLSYLNRALSEGDRHVSRVDDVSHHGISWCFPQQHHPEHEWYHYQFKHSNGIWVELHWNIAERSIPIAANINSIWERLETHHFLGNEVLAFSVEDLIIVLCVHWARHRWKLLILGCDILELIVTHPDLDWNRLIASAKRMGCDKYVLCGVALVVQLFGISLINDRDLKPDFGMNTFVKSTCNNYFTISAVPTPFLRECSVQFLLNERLPDRLSKIFLLLGRRIASLRADFLRSHSVKRESPSSP